MQRPGSRCFRISFGILWQEKQGRTSPWWVQRVALTWAADKVMRTCNQDRLDMPDPDSHQTLGVLLDPELGRKDGTSVHTCSLLLYSQCVPWVNRLCVEVDRGGFLYAGGRETAGLLKFLEHSNILTPPISLDLMDWDPIETSPAWTLLFAHLHWHHVKFVSQFFLMFRFLLNPSPEGIY